jgi:hypothetical protein
MLNEEYTQKAEMLLQVVKDSKEAGNYPPLSVYDIEWLVETIDFMVRRYEEHAACCLSECMRQPNSGSNSANT